MAAQSLVHLPLRAGISESHVETDDLTYHILEAGYDPDRPKPLVLLIHGFPELAFSWRKVMPGIAAAGYHVVAYDQRGYGRTTGWDTRPFHEVDLNTFSLTRLVTDALRLVNALGYMEVECVVGHDFGAVVSSMCALMREDVFKSVIMMSHPFNGSPNFPFNTARNPPGPKVDVDDVHKALAELPQPRKHYKWYYSIETANQEMTEPKDGLHEFLRGYFYLKSADWSGNDPRPLSTWSAVELAKMPSYYIMPLDLTMRSAVAKEMSTIDKQLVQEQSERWLPDRSLAVYVAEFARTTFQGGLNYYRVSTDPMNMKDVELFAGKNIDVPSLFISGRKDWGTYQTPGAIENLSKVCSRFMGVQLVDAAGHWVQQEQPDEVLKLILKFLAGVRTERAAY